MRGVTTYFPIVLINDVSDKWNYTVYYYNGLHGERLEYRDGRNGKRDGGNFASIAWISHFEIFRARFFSSACLRLIPPVIYSGRLALRLGDLMKLLSSVVWPIALRNPADITYKWWSRAMFYIVNQLI